MEIIEIDKTARTALNNKYGTWNVSRALNFRSNSYLCRAIRRDALANFGGKKKLYKLIS